MVVLTDTTFREVYRGRLHSLPERKARLCKRGMSPCPSLYVFSKPCQGGALQSKRAKCLPLAHVNLAVRVSVSFNVYLPCASFGHPHPCPEHGRSDHNPLRPLPAFSLTEGSVHSMPQPKRRKILGNMLLGRETVEKVTKGIYSSEKRAGI